MAAVNKTTYQAVGISRRTAIACCGWSLSCLAIAAGDDKPKQPSPAASSQLTTPTHIKKFDGLLEEIRAEFHLPALAAGIVTPLGLQENGCVGVRKLGDKTPITNADLWHLGSCTKAMTATMIATLVKEDKLHWATRLDDIFPELSEKMSHDFRRITLTQLLSHHSGLPANAAWHDLGSKLTTTEQRRRLLDDMLIRGLDHPPGTKFAYSNVGYALAGLLAETVAGQAWEDLMQERLFRPLKMQAVGFGIPGRLGHVDQPWGHHSTLLGLGPLKAVQIDNAACLGPAGTVHASLKSWSQFLAAHLSADPSLLPPEIWDRLHRPNGTAQATDGNAALGWMAIDRVWAHGSDGQGLALTHSGSNTANYCVCWLAPHRQFGIIACTNTGQTNAAQALDKTVSQLITSRFGEQQ